MNTADIEIPEVSRQVVGIEPGQPRYKILIADDNPSSRKLLFTILEPFGFELREAGNSREAFEIWHEWRPDLIWMDIRMPVMDGYEATRRIREVEKLQVAGSKLQLDASTTEPASCNVQAATCIIAQTASAFEEEREVVLAVGCDDFLRKPYKESEIFDMMHQHIGICFVYEASETASEKDASLRRK